MSEAAPTDTEQPANDGESPVSVDWAALWEEFGFDTPDAAGYKLASDTQLTAALQSTEQSPPGDAAGHIQRGLNYGHLIACESDDGTLRGYAHVGGEQ